MAFTFSFQQYGGREPRHPSKTEDFSNEGYGSENYSTGELTAQPAGYATSDQNPGEGYGVSEHEDYGGGEHHSDPFGNGSGSDTYGGADQDDTDEEDVQTHHSAHEAAHSQAATGTPPPNGQMSNEMTPHALGGLPTHFAAGVYADGKWDISKCTDIHTPAGSVRPTVASYQAPQEFLSSAGAAGDGELQAQAAHSMTPAGGFQGFMSEEDIQAGAAGTRAIAEANAHSLASAAVFQSALPGLLSRAHGMDVRTGTEMTQAQHQAAAAATAQSVHYGGGESGSTAVAFLAGPRERIHVFGNPVEHCPRCQQEGTGTTNWRPHRHIGELKIRYICERHFDDLESNHHFDIPLCPLCGQVLYLYDFNAMLGISSARRLHKYVLKCSNRHVLPLLDLFCQTKKGRIAAVTQQSVDGVVAGVAGALSSHALSGGERCNANFKLQWCYGTMVKRCEAQKNRDHDLWWVRYKNEWKQRRTIIRYKKDFLQHLSDVQRALLLGLGAEGEPPPDPKAALGPTYDALVATSGGSPAAPKIKKRQLATTLSSTEDFDYDLGNQAKSRRDALLQTGAHHHGHGHHQAGAAHVFATPNLFHASSHVTLQHQFQQAAAQQGHQFLMHAAHHGHHHHNTHQQHLQHQQQQTAVLESTQSQQAASMSQHTQYQAAQALVQGVSSSSHHPHSGATSGNATAFFQSPQGGYRHANPAALQQVEQQTEG